MQLKHGVRGLAAGVVLATGMLGVASAHDPANDAFERTWERTDRPIQVGAVDRTWLWGPEAISGEMMEFYEGAHNNGRTVQYFDKSRMEINHDIEVPGDSPWYVTNGLLVVELVTGQMQIGDQTFVDRGPAEIPVAGDPSSFWVPTYADLASLMDQPQHALGSVIATTVGPDGALGKAPRLSAYDVTAYRYVPETGHTVAEPFWSFMNSTGPVYENGQVVSDELFENPFYATGYPITEAYWTLAMVDGVETDVLVQAFERRVLTYTPSNDPEWQIESGNVGRHYYQWRYNMQPEQQ